MFFLPQAQTRQLLPRVSPWITRSAFKPLLLRKIQTTPETHNDYEAKYADKLRQYAQEKGLTLNELRAMVREGKMRPQKSAKIDVGTSTTEKPMKSFPSSPSPSYKDSSPIRPLSSFLNVSRLLSTPHTPAQISALWTTYHASRAGGTGRGYLCACVPVDAYQKMLRVAGQYPSFIIPIPRDKNSTPRQDGDKEGGGRAAYEFYFLQWGFHGSPPPLPSAIPSGSISGNSESAAKIDLPQTTTVLFTPLEEYKLRKTFATPHLVLTHYAEFALTHGIVLLRGELTPTTAKDDPTTRGEFLLDQQEAQVMAVGVQKFYLWGQGGEEGENEREGLLKVFHEKPEDFKWEELLKYADTMQ